MPTLPDDHSLSKLKPSTLQTYQTVYERCVRRACEKRDAESSEDFEMNAMYLVDDWLSLKGTRKPRTSNTERSALIWMIQANRPKDWEEASERLQSLRQETLYPKDDQKSSLKPTDRRSREPGRMLPEEDLKSLINELANMRDPGARAQYFLLAGVASGARPVEWLDATWVDKEMSVLRIFTAKVKTRNAWDKIPPLTFTDDDLDDEINQQWGASAQSTSSTTTLAFHEVDFERRIATLSLTDEECEELRANRHLNGVLLFRDVKIEPEHQMHVRLHMESVRHMIHSVSEQAIAAGKLPPSREKIFEDFYFHPVRHTIWRACKKIFTDKLYSPVDTRSTFSANRKARFGLGAAAKDLGHAGITTARDFYAPASKAWTKYKAADNPKDGTQSQDSVQTFVASPSATTTQR